MEKIIILDFGGQYCHLIARRIRELGVCAEVVPANISLSALNNPSVKGVILSGGASSVFDKKAPSFNKKIKVISTISTSFRRKSWKIGSMV